VKCEIVLDENCEEKIVIYAKAKTPFINEIIALAEQAETELTGYKSGEIVKLNLSEIQYISTINSKVYAAADRENYLIKERLYSIEARLPKNFVKINQSCLANIKKMERFDTSISGTLKIRFKNGHIDYVSRRQLKTIKERLGI
jgi:DNA-binding LytR/AlgR family response regulator